MSVFYREIHLWRIVKFTDGGAGERDQEPIARGLDLAPAVAGQDVAEDEAVFLDQLERERLVMQGQRALADLVRENDPGELAVVSGGSQPFSLARIALTHCRRRR